VFLRFAWVRFAYQANYANCSAFIGVADIPTTYQSIPIAVMASTVIRDVFGKYWLPGLNSAWRLEDNRAMIRLLHGSDR
jgi:hypothetical protein